MKDYSAMSDFEINKAVADIAMNGTWHLEPSHLNNTTGGWLYGSNGIQTYPMPDYCNSAADAYPIIMDNKISILNLYQACNCHDGWMAKFSHVSSKIESNPLRAAMIVFLMMKDRESSHA